MVPSLLANRIQGTAGSAILGHLGHLSIPSARVDTAYNAAVAAGTTTQTRFSPLLSGPLPGLRDLPNFTVTQFLQGKFN